MAEKTTRKFKPINCVDCGKLVERKSPATVRCPECKIHHRREQARVKRRNKGIPKKEDGSCSLCKQTEICVYGGRMSGIPICDYIGVTGHSRGCPVEGCTKIKRRETKDE